MAENYNRLLQTLDIYPSHIAVDAAHAIRALRLENIKLREALTRIASCESHHAEDVVDIAKEAIKVQ
jgi:hypothetical protein